MAIKTDISEKFVDLGVLKNEEAAKVLQEAESSGVSFQRALSIF